MAVMFQRLHPMFAGEVSGIDLRAVDDRQTLEEIRAGLDEFAVLVFRNQRFTDEEQSEFTERFGKAVAASSQSGGGNTEADPNAPALSTIEHRLVLDLIKVSNVDERNEIVAPNDLRRVSKLGNRIWHTDGSSLKPSGRYTMLSGRTIPPVRADTQFVDTRAAYEALDEEMKATVEGLSVFHSLVYSRRLLGFQFPKEEEEKLKGAVHPLVRTIPGVNRKSLYLGAHAAEVVGWPIPEGRLLIKDLTEQATLPQFVYSHEWRQDDLLIWDDWTTLHRARPFDDSMYQRDMRRTMILDQVAAA